MNVQEYIESGILEQYVLQQLTPVEQLEVERIRAMHPEVDVEINRIEETLFQEILCFFSICMEFNY